MLLLFIDLTLPSALQCADSDLCWVKFRRLQERTDRTGESWSKRHGRLGRVLDSPMDTRQSKGTQ